MRQLLYGLDGTNLPAQLNADVWKHRGMNGPVHFTTAQINRMRSFWRGSRDKICWLIEYCLRLPTEVEQGGDEAAREIQQSVKSRLACEYPRLIDT